MHSEVYRVFSLSVIILKIYIIFQGEWKPKQIDNPNYKGPWIHPEIDNPEYTSDPELYKRDEICAIGFDLWQVKSGTIFDNVLITDDPEVARKFGEDVWKLTLVSTYSLLLAVAFYLFVQLLICII